MLFYPGGYTGSSFSLGFLVWTGGTAVQLSHRHKYGAAVTFCTDTLKVRKDTMACFYASNAVVFAECLASLLAETAYCTGMMRD